MQTSFDNVPQMASAQPAVAAMAAQAAPASQAARAGGSGEMSFGQVLSCLNPLQYVPVVGMIYRAITGDTIPEPVRVAGGLAFSALTGGPIGVVLSAATEVVEQATGIDPEKIGHSVMASIGLASPDATTTSVASSAKAAPSGARPAAPADTNTADPADTRPAAPASGTAMIGVADLAKCNQAYAWAAEPIIGSGG